MNQYVESTLLDPTMTDLDVDNLVQSAVEHKFHGVCVPPFWVKRAAREALDTDLALVTTNVLDHCESIKDERN